MILCSIDKAEIEDVLSLQLPTTKRRGTKVLVRTGDYTLMKYLKIVSCMDAAVDIVVQAEGGNADKADASVLRTVLSLRGIMDAAEEQNFGKGNLKRPRIVAEIRDVDNQLLLQTVGGSNVQTIVSHDIIGRIMIKSARTPGLAHVYEDILGFEGAEFYMHCWDAEFNDDGSRNTQRCKEVVGARFGDLSKVFQNAIPFGVRRPDHPGDHHDELQRVADHLMHGETGPQRSADIVAAKVSGSRALSQSPT